MHGGPGHHTDRCQIAIAIAIAIRYDARCARRSGSDTTRRPPLLTGRSRRKRRMPPLALSRCDNSGEHTHTHIQRFRYGGGIGSISLSRPTTCGVQGRGYYPIFTIFSSWWWWWWCPRGVGDRFEPLRRQEPEEDILERKEENATSRHVQTPVAAVPFSFLFAPASRRRSRKDQPHTVRAPQSTDTSPACLPAEDASQPVPPVLLACRTLGPMGGETGLVTGPAACQPRYAVVLLLARRLHPAPSTGREKV